jgi:hypothetical protein
MIAASGSKMPRSASSPKPNWVCQAAVICEKVSAMPASSSEHSTQPEDTSGPSALLLASTAEPALMAAAATHAQIYLLQDLETEQAITDQIERGLRRVPMSQFGLELVDVIAYPTAQGRGELMRRGTCVYLT